MAKNKKWGLSGIDFLHTGTNYIKDYLQLDACQGSIVDMNFRDNQFDLVTCSEVLENSQNYKNFFSGTREFKSPFWADIYRSLGYNFIMLDNLKCPLCSVDLSRKKVSHFVENNPPWVSCNTKIVLKS